MKFHLSLITGSITEPKQKDRKEDVEGVQDYVLGHQDRTKKEGIYNCPLPPQVPQEIITANNPFSFYRFTTNIGAWRRPTKSEENAMNLWEMCVHSESYVTKLKGTKTQWAPLLRLLLSRLDNTDLTYVKQSLGRRLFFDWLLD